MSFNYHGVRAIYRFELARFLRTAWSSLATPVITTYTLHRARTCAASSVLTP